jgi:hypothetical protein
MNTMNSRKKKYSHYLTGIGLAGQWSVEVTMVEDERNKKVGLRVVCGNPTKYIRRIDGVTVTIIGR